MRQQMRQAALASTYTRMILLAREGDDAALAWLKGFSGAWDARLRLCRSSRPRRWRSPSTGMESRAHDLRVGDSRALCKAEAFPQTVTPESQRKNFSKTNAVPD